MGCGEETKDLYLEDLAFRECEEFKYLGVKIDKEDREENDIKNRINKGRAMKLYIATFPLSMHKLCFFL